MPSQPIEQVALLFLGLIVGGIIGWLWMKTRIASAQRLAEDRAKEQYNELREEYIGYKATSTEQIQYLRNEADRFQSKMEDLQKLLTDRIEEITQLRKQAI